MRHRRSVRLSLLAVLAAVPVLLGSPVAANGPARTPAPEGASLYILSPHPGEVVSSPVTVRFGLSGMGVAPAGVQNPKTGHHHLTNCRPRQAGSGGREAHALRRRADADRDPISAGDVGGRQVLTWIAGGYSFKLVAALLDTLPFYAAVAYLSRWLQIDPQEEHSRDREAVETRGS